jgi:hypothetical protein
MTQTINQQLPLVLVHPSKYFGHHTDHCIQPCSIICVISLLFLLLSLTLGLTYDLSTHNILSGICLTVVSSSTYKAQAILHF